MRREDIIWILCKLTSYHTAIEFNTVETRFFCDFEKRKYEIKLERKDGQLIFFQIKDTGEVINEEN